MDRRNLNDDGKRPREIEPEKETRSSILFIVNDLESLRKCWISLTEDKKRRFREQSGKIDAIMDIKVDEDAIWAIMGFFDHELRCFILPKVDLAFTFEEYHRLLNMVWSEEDTHIYIPDKSKMVAGENALKPILQGHFGVRHPWMKGALKSKNGSFCVNWPKVFTNMGDAWKFVNSVKRIKLFALGIFGLVLFPTFDNMVDSRVMDLVVHIATTAKKRCLMTPVLAETLRTCVAIKRDKITKLRCCTQLFTMWIHNHFQPEKVVQYPSLYFKGTDHVSMFLKQGQKKMDEEEGYDELRDLGYHEGKLEGMPELED